MPSAWSVSVVVTICVINVAMFLERAYVFTWLSFDGGGACYGMISAQITNSMVIKKVGVSARRFELPSAIMTSWPPSSARMISPYVCFFLWTITTVTMMKNILTHARPVEQTSCFQFVCCWQYVYLIVVLAELLPCKLVSSLSEVHDIGIFCCIWLLFCRWTGVLIIVIARAIFYLHWTNITIPEC